MAIKNYKPVNNSRRGMTVTDYSGLSKVAPEKSLLEPVKKTAGRNSYGRITVRHRGGGNRKKKPVEICKLRDFLYKIHFFTEIFFNATLGRNTAIKANFAFIMENFTVSLKGVYCDALKHSGV